MRHAQSSQALQSRRGSLQSHPVPEGHSTSEPLALAAWLAISLVKQHNVRETPLGHRATLNSDLGKEFLQRRPGLLRAVIDVVDVRLG